MNREREGVMPVPRYPESQRSGISEAKVSWAIFFEKGN
jgi:hypothetical protein